MYRILGEVKSEKDAIVKISKTLAHLKRDIDKGKIRHVEYVFSDCIYNLRVIADSMEKLLDKNELTDTLAFGVRQTSKILDLIGRILEL